MEAQGTVPADPERFAFLASVSDAVRVMLPLDAEPAARDELRTVLFHAWAFWRAGRRTYRLEPAVARFLVEALPALGGWTLRLPQPALYLQLPPNLFWATTGAGAKPEPLDGIWVTAAEPARRLFALLVLGLRRDRPGFSVIRVEAAVPPDGPAAWIRAPARTGGRDFATTLPGGDLGGLYSVVTPAESLKLVAAALWYLDEHADLVDFSEDGTFTVRMSAPEA